MHHVSVSKTKVSYNSVRPILGMSLSELAAHILASREAGEKLNDLKRRLCLGSDTLLKLQKFAMLARRPDLAAQDRAVVETALADLDATRQTIKAWAMVAPIYALIYGSPKGGKKEQLARERLAHFDQALTVTAARCTELPNITIPYLTPVALADAFRQIIKAQAGLSAMRAKLKGLQK